MRMRQRPTNYSGPALISFNWGHYRRGFGCRADTDYKTPRIHQIGPSDGMLGIFVKILCTPPISRASAERIPPAHSVWSDPSIYSVSFDYCRRVWPQTAARKILRRCSKCRLWALFAGSSGGSIRVLGTNRCLRLAMLTLSSHSLRLWSCRGQSPLFWPRRCGILCFKASNQNVWSSTYSR